MATAVDNKAFVDQIFKEIVWPARDRLMETPYFNDLRAGTLTTRRLQGFSLEHTWFNRALLRASALRMLRAPDNEQFLAAAGGLIAEITHPDLCQRFGIAMGLTKEDFSKHVPLQTTLDHTSAIVASPITFGNPAAGRVSGMTNETIVQRYTKSTRYA